jgi:rubrerythrin
MTEHFELLEARKNIKQLTKERDFWAGVVDKALELGHDDKTHLALAMLILVPEAPEKPAPKSSTARTTVPEHLPKSSKPEGAHDPATCRNSTAVDDGKAGVPIPWVEQRREQIEKPAPNIYQHEFEHAKESVDNFHKAWKDYHVQQARLNSGEDDNEKPALRQLELVTITADEIKREPAPKHYKCKVCSQEFDDFDTYYGHTTSIHNIVRLTQGDLKKGDKRCTCDGTGVINTPSGKKPCPICNKPASTSTAVKKKGDGGESNG